MKLTALVQRPSRRRAACRRAATRFSLERLEERSLMTVGSATATFLKQDASTQGSWVGVYGSQGSDVIGDAPAYPSYAAVTPSGQTALVWQANSPDARALRNPGGSGRIASTWYAAPGFGVDVNLTDGNAHDVALYLYDWSMLGRTETVQVADAGTGAVLDTRTLTPSQLDTGMYLQWKVSGHVVFTFTASSGRNALLSGLFLDPAGESPSAAAYTVSVRDFGAKGDGVTDDAPAIQAALDSVPAGGGTVLVPAGDYRLGSSLVISHDGTTFTGEGASSILRLMDGVQQSGIILPQRYGGNLDPNFIVNNVTISDLTIDGNHNPVVVPGKGQPDYFGVFVRQASNVTLSGLVVRDWASDGISMSMGGVPVDRITVEDCLVTGIHRSGIEVGFATNVTIRENRITDTPSQWWGPAAANAIDVEVEGWNSARTFPGETGTFSAPYVVGLTIQDNILERTMAATSGDGVALQPSYGAISNVTIRGNLISGFQFAVETSGTLGLYGRVAGVDGVTVQNNWMSVDPGFAVSGNPMELNGCADVVVESNVMNDAVNGNFSGGGSNAAVNVGGAKNIQIRNNTIRLDQIWPDAIAKIYGGSDSVAVTGNSYQTTGDTQVMNDGTSTNVTVSGNTSLTGTPWDRTPPTASFGIAAGTVISSPTQVTVNASDTGSGVARVYFFVDGVPQGYSDTAPYVFAFDPSRYSAGLHELEAVAIDNSAIPSIDASLSVQVV